MLTDANIDLRDSVDCLVRQDSLDMIQKELFDEAARDSINAPPHNPKLTGGFYVKIAGTPAL